MSIPLISVIIPTFNRPAKLEACLASLNRGIFPPTEFEVIVVDDGSEIPLQLDWSGVLTIRVIRQSNGGPAKARNAGAREARGALLLFTDDDCEPEFDWLAQMAKAHRDNPAAMLGGRTLNGLPDDLCATASQILLEFLFIQFNEPQGDGAFFTSNNLAVPSAGFAEIGGFHTNFPKAAGEDREFCDRWRHSGRALRYTPDALIRHRHDLDLRQFWTQHKNYGGGAYRFHRLRASRQQSPIKIEPLTFYLRLLIFPWKTHSGLRATVLGALLFISQVANAIGYFCERAEQRGGTLHK